jgi:CheY-like chemotaxis protein
MEAATMPETYPGAAPTGRVLIADDQPQILEALQLLLKGGGLSTEAVTHPARAC